jgi:hypothetical protein
MFIYKFLLRSIINSKAVAHFILWDIELSIQEVTIWYTNQIQKGDITMRKLWHDIQTHKRAAVLFLVYWIATVVVTFIKWDQGIPFLIVLTIFTLPLIAGILVGLWRSSTPEHTTRLADKIGGGMLAGILCTEIRLLVIKGGVIDEFIGWMRGWGERWGEMLLYFIVFGVLGIVLGFIGAVFTSIMEYYRIRIARNSS